jgi:ParB/RepB/Spo0J family partition protein
MPLTQERVLRKKVDKNLPVQQEEESSKVLKIKNINKLIRIDPRIIIIDPNFNPEGRCDNIETLKASIKESGLKVPLQCFMDKDGRYHLNCGHRRLTSILQLIEEGIEIQSVEVILVPRQTPEERILALLLNNDGERLTAVQEGEVFNRMVGFGIAQVTIAEKIGKTQTHVSARISLFNKTSQFLKDLMADGKLSTAVIHKIIEAHPEDEQSQKEMVLKILKGLQKIGRDKIRTTDIPDGKHVPKRMNKIQTLFSNTIDIMKEDASYDSKKVAKAEAVFKCLSAGSPKELLRLLTAHVL